jgi:hypothetical protein
MIGEVTKYDTGKYEHSDLPRKALINTIKAFNYGQKKYNKFNYSGKIEALRLYDACQRHLDAWLMGEDMDESGNSHLSHASASILMLEEGVINNTVIDNRNKIYTKVKENQLKLEI